jgi:hypothetical protein
MRGPTSHVWHGAATGRSVLIHVATLGTPLAYDARALALCPLPLFEVGHHACYRPAAYAAYRHATMGAEDMLASAEAALRACTGGRASEAGLETIVRQCKETLSRSVAPASPLPIRHTPVDAHMCRYRTLFSVCVCMLRMAVSVRFV